MSCQPWRWAVPCQRERWPAYTWHFSAADRRQPRRTLAVGCAGGGLADEPQLVVGVADLRGPAESFHAFMVARDATLRRLKTSGTVDGVLPVVAKTDFPRSYVFHADIRSDAGFWINRWTARYYGPAAVRATDGTAKADR